MRTLFSHWFRLAFVGHPEQLFVRQSVAQPVLMLHAGFTKGATHLKTPVPSLKGWWKFSRHVAHAGAMVSRTVKYDWQVDELGPAAHAARASARFCALHAFVAVTGVVLTPAGHLP